MRCLLPRLCVDNSSNFAFNTLPVQVIANHYHVHVLRPKNKLSYNASYLQPFRHVVDVLQFVSLVHQHA